MADDQENEDTQAIQPGEAAISSTSLHERIRSVLDVLKEREAGMVSMRFDEPKTIDEILMVWGVTPEEIRQIESNLMCKLRQR